MQRSPLLAARLLFCAVLNDFFQGFKALVKVQLAGIHQHGVFGLAQRGCCTVGPVSDLLFYFYLDQFSPPVLAVSRCDRLGTFSNVVHMKKGVVE